MLPVLFLKVLVLVGVWKMIKLIPRSNLSSAKKMSLLFSGEAIPGHVSYHFDFNFIIFRIQ
jgi:hypothetical protein